MTILTQAFAKAAKRIAVDAGKAAAGVVLNKLIDSLVIMTAKRAELTGKGPAAQAFNRFLHQAVSTNSDSMRLYAEAVAGPAILRHAKAAMSHRMQR